MKNIKLNTGITALALGAAICASLVACGGGSSPAAGIMTSSGVAAIGSAIVGGTVSFTCASGATASATTGSDGSYSATLKATDYPCVVQASGGQANGVALASALHSVAAASGTTNVTPLTDLIVGVLGNGNASALDGASSGVLSGTISAGNLTSALAKVTTAIGTLPGKLTLSNGFNPLNSQFSVGDANDALLDQYATALQATGLTQASAATKTAAGTALTQQTYSLTAYTTPGMTAIPMGAALNLDGTLGFAVTDPAAGSYFATANADANSNITSFLNPGKFTGFVSQLGNRVGELCTKDSGGYDPNQHSQYVYVSSDMVPVTDPSELVGQTFAEYEDCNAYGSAAISGTASALTYTYTQTGGSPDPSLSFTQALSDTGYRDGDANTRISNIRTRAYKYTDAAGKTTYVYVMVASQQGSTTEVFDGGEADYVTVGISQPH